MYLAWRAFTLAAVAVVGLCASAAWGYSLLLGTRLDHGVDSYGWHGFHTNPALFKPEQFVVQLLSYRVRSSTTYTEESGNNSFDETADRTEAYLAASGMADLGGGLWLGFQVEQLDLEMSSIREDVNDTVIPERADSQFAALKAAVELSELVAVGFTLKFLKVEHAVVGSFGVDPATSTTTFSTSMFGSGGGLSVNNGKFAFSAAYFPAMKGKADVLGEEKIITDPGASDLGLGFTIKETIRAGLRYRRWIYKDDDRSDGTTLNDNNQTQVNLYGVHRRMTNIAPLTSLTLGAGIPLGKDINIMASLTRDTMTWVVDPTTNLPGENEDDPSDTRTTIKALLVIDRAKLSFSIGTSLSNGTSDFSESSNNRNVTRKWDENRQDLWLGVGALL